MLSCCREAENVKKGSQEPGSHRGGALGTQRVPERRQAPDVSCRETERAGVEAAVRQEQPHPPRAPGAGPHPTSRVDPVTLGLERQGGGTGQSEHSTARCKATQAVQGLPQDVWLSFQEVAIEQVGWEALVQRQEPVEPASGSAHPQQAMPPMSHGLLPLQARGRQERAHLRLLAM